MMYFDEASMEIPAFENEEKNFDNCQMVVIEDYTEYVDGFSCNGGNYIYYDVFRRRNDGYWDRFYDSSCEMEGYENLGIVDDAFVAECIYENSGYGDICIRYE